MFLKTAHCVSMCRLLRDFVTCFHLFFMCSFAVNMCDMMVPQQGFLFRFCYIVLQLCNIKKNSRSTVWLVENTFPSFPYPGFPASSPVVAVVVNVSIVKCAVVVPLPICAFGSYSLHSCVLLSLP